MITNLTLPSAIATLTDDLGLTPADIASAVGATPTEVAAWRAGVAHPSSELHERLSALHDVACRLLDTFTTVEAARGWLRAPSLYLRGGYPIDELQAGRPWRVDAALEALASGIFL